MVFNLLVVCAALFSVLPCAARHRHLVWPLNSHVLYRPNASLALSSIEYQFMLQIIVKLAFRLVHDACISLHICCLWLYRLLRESSG